MASSDQSLEAEINENSTFRKGISDIKMKNNIPSPLDYYSLKRMEQFPNIDENYKKKEVEK